MKITRILLLLFILSSCSTSQKAFKRGDYYDATLKAVKQLRNKPDAKNASEVVQKSYPMALEYYRQKVNELTASNQPDKYLKIVETYSLLNTLADEITRCPAALELVKPVVYFHAQMQKAGELAVQEQFNRARQLMETTNYVDARMAVEKLEWVRQRQPNYQNLETVLLQARDLATLKTVVELLPPRNVNTNINTQVFYMRTLDFLDKKIENQYTRFYQPDQAEQITLKPHEILSVQFAEFQIGAMVEREKESKYESDSIEVGSYTDSDGISHSVFGTVKATAHQYEREVRAKALLEVKIIDFQTEAVLASQKFPGEYIWNNEWASFNGDERALPEQVFKLTKKKQQMPPSAQDLFLLLSDPMFQDMSNFLRNYYKRK